MSETNRGYRIVTKAANDERAEQLEGNGKVTPAGATKPAANGAPKTTAIGAKPAAKVTPRVPSVIGLDGKQAKEILEKLGYEVKGQWGSEANRDEELRRVERQDPDAKSILAPGETVTIWLFKKPAAAAE